MPSLLEARKHLWAVALIAGFAAQGAVAQDEGADPFVGERHIDPQAEQYMKAACQLLKGQQAFSVHGEATVEQLFRNGRRIQRSRGVTVVLQRPDKLWGEVRSDKGHRMLHFDGKTLVINDLDDKVYGKIESPGNVEQMLTHAQDRFDVVLPLADLLYDDPCAALKTSAENAWYLGKSYFAGDYFHHILISSPEVDLQVWVSDGKQPLFRKLVLTYKNEPGEPQYGIALSDWNFRPNLRKAQFIFKPAADAREIQFVTAEATASATQE
jgi:hypothetical protein